MKDNIEKIKLMKLETLNEFQNHISNVLIDLDVYRKYVNKKRLKALNHCYYYLDTLWESIEDTICQIYEEKESEDNN